MRRGEQEEEQEQGEVAKRPTADGRKCTRHSRRTERSAALRNKLDEGTEVPILPPHLRMLMQGSVGVKEEEEEEEEEVGLTRRGSPATRRNTGSARSACSLSSPTYGR